MDFAANRATGMANRLQSLKRVTEKLSLSVSVGVGVSSAPQKGAGGLVWLLPSVRSFRVYVCMERRKRERERQLIPAFALSIIQPNIN